MKLNTLMTALGICIGIALISWWPGPFIPWQSNTPLPTYDDKAKQAFVATFISTFDAGNPESEIWDSHKPRADQMRKKTYYTSFEKSIKRIVPDECSTRSLVVPTTYQNEGAKDREFIVFDTENCKTAN